jgi:hypothetical protein
MPDLRFATLATIFVLWWAISVVNQVRTGALTVRLRRQLPFGLIPIWTFFAPNPARADYRLVWRGEWEDRWAGWQEVHFGFAPALTRWMINPQLVQNNAVTDLVGTLQRMRPEARDRTVLLSSAYLTLLHLVITDSCHDDYKFVQFAIISTSTHAPQRLIEPIFLSEIHSTARAPQNVC